MSETRVNNSENESFDAQVLAAADDARIRKQVVARLTLFTGIFLVAGSIMFWPQGLFGLGRSAPAVSILLVSSGAFLLILGSLVIALSVRRLTRLKNSYTSAGRPDAGFVFEPDLGLPQIGHGHGGPMDASGALFANPDKVMNGRK